MNNLTKYGDLMIDGEFIVCAHPGLCCRRHNYAIEGQGLFDVLVDEKENTLNKPKSVEIQIVKSGTGWSKLGNVVEKNLSNESHGGILIVDMNKLASLGDDFEDSHDVKLWNFFADGLCLKRPTEYLDWKSNRPGGNIVFVPSWDYHWVYTLEGGNGYSILCNQEFDG